MIKKIRSYLQYGNRFCGIEHTIKNEKEIIISTILIQSKKEIDIESFFETYTVEEACQKIKKKQHVSLVINNDKVISKQIESEQKTPLKLIQKAFPNININDFFYEVLSEENIHFVSLCRKSYVQEIIDAYKKLNIFIISVSMGNSSISVIKSFIDSNVVYTSNSKILIENDMITKIEKNNYLEDNNYNINGLTVSGIGLLSFSAALNTLLKVNITKTNLDAIKTTLLSDFKQIRFFQQFLKFAGLFLLLGLLINFLMFNYYFNKVNELTQVSEINNSTKAKIIKLNASVSKKQKMVEDLLKSNGSKSSFYVNVIIHSLPKSILLSEFNYQPLLKRVKSEKQIEINKNSITIFGVSNDSEIFSIWINQLEQQNWIEKIDIIAYGLSASNTSDFKIKIILDDE
ncbi:hypothetical protein [Olleya sp. Bg11-27]|uniref:hypothetical protein n=1 Tax=Olleya sp. Bg11-27 TaxID=2058135 RepID=UPI000C3031FE|nr:hypothetical protein [Olleya sp. Bg11-27]AUC77573.1 hypothetical protein CW732_18565 [Olleya sp. Bg11-27]